MALLAFAACAPLLSHHTTSARCQARVIRCATQTEPKTSPPSPDEAPPRATRVVAATTFLLYTYSTFSYASGDPTSARSLGVGLVEAVQLSVNFAYVTPVLLPALAPVFAPTYEALFNLVVAWAFLFLGFASEDLPAPQRPLPYAAVATLLLFVTNFVYLPYLVVRAPRARRVQPVAAPSPLLRVAESRLLPGAVAALAAASLAWALFGRAAAGDAGDIVERFHQFRTLLSTDILAHSLGLDCVALALLQSALVNDDVKRRGWDGPECNTAVAMARFVPLFGLVYYLWRRAEHASLIRR